MLVEVKELAERLPDRRQNIVEILLNSHGKDDLLELESHHLEALEMVMKELVESFPVHHHNHPLHNILDILVNSHGKLRLLELRTQFWLHRN